MPKKSKRWTVVGYWPSEGDTTNFWVWAPDWETAVGNAAKQASKISEDEIIMIGAFRGHIKDQSDLGGYGRAYRSGEALSP